MAIFKEAPRESGAEPTRRSSQPASLSIIASDLTVIGDLETDGVVKIEGRVQGAVRAGTQVLVAKEALIEGDIHTKDAVIGGEVTGAIRADQRVEIQATALVNGDIITQRMIVLEGGRVNGEIKMDRAEAAEKPTSASPSAPTTPKTAIVSS